MAKVRSETILNRNGPVLVLAAATASVLFATLYVMIGGWTDPDSLVWTNRDFVNYWMASRLALQGAAMDLFSGQDIYFSHLQALFGPHYPWHNWSYPPSFLLLVLPLGFLSFHVSMTLFLLVTGFIYLHAVTLAARRINRASVLLLVPFIACNILTAQNGFLTSALMLYGLCLRQARPVLAGIAIGLLTVKPQLGILLPFLLVFERRWLVVLVAAMTALIMVVMTGLVFGFDTWRGYLEHNLPYQAQVMADMSGTFLQMMPSVYGTLRGYGFDSSFAMTAHVLFAVIAMLIFCVALFRLKSCEERSLCLLLATFLISPYALIYDLGALSALAAITAYAVDEKRLAVARKLALIMVAFLPLLQIVFFVYYGLAVAPFVLFAALLLLVAPSFPALRLYEKNGDRDG